MVSVAARAPVFKDTGTGKIQAKMSMLELESKMDKLALICRAMWELLEEKTDLTEEELTAKVKEIDLLDGKLDDKLGSVSMKCKSCGKMISSRYKHCMYCRAEHICDSVFDKI